MLPNFDLGIYFYSLQQIRITLDLPHTTEHWLLKNCTLSRRNWTFQSIFSQDKNVENKLALHKYGDDKKNMQTTRAFIEYCT